MATRFGLTSVGSLAGALLLMPMMSARAQDLSPTAACGDEKAQFDVSLGPRSSPVPAPAAGAARLYIIELGDLSDKHRFGRPTVRQGLDGAWIGATQGFSFVRADVQPGDHHLCSRWQSHFSRLTSEISLNNFTAEAGRTYYFRLQITFQGSGGDAVGPPVIDLQPVSEDEGRFLVTEAAPSVSRLK